MAIKMRSNDNQEAVCCNCGESREQVLNMFDLCIGDTIVTICDVCNEQILNKTLKAECLKNGRVKSGHDMSIIRRRGQAAYEDRQWERIAAGRATGEPAKGGKRNGKQSKRK